jgi:glyoxylase-like metal-dependent hydrolase (beta-lactamase superfamily II)/rhodanese-related sulfurtransferase
MILNQYYLACLAHASYLVADETTMTAVVVDPQRDVDQYIADAESLGLRIGYVFLTHFHADFIAGHLELRDRVGATICLGKKAEAEFTFRAFGDGDSLDLGNVRITAVETPGHTPEAISLLVYDLATDPANPYAVLTGDTLFIGDVGRPDLMASVGVTAEELANALYDSLREKLLPLPDATLVYPAHGAGSMCGRNLSSETVSTIGVQRQYNYALQPMSREQFVALVTADQPEAPAYFGYDAMLNRRERATLEAVLDRELRPLSLEETLAAVAGGALLLDVRDAADFEGAHLRGALNIGLDGQFASWAGTLIDHGQPIVVVADPGREIEAATRLGRIGFDRVVGYLDGGMAALGSRDDLLVRSERITAATVLEQLGGANSPVVVDVRNANEREAGRVAGSLHIPLNHLSQRIAEVPEGRPIVVHCQGGYRSAIGVSMLERAGRDGAADMVGGFGAWEAAGLPVETGVEPARVAAGRSLS